VKGRDYASYILTAAFGELTKHEKIFRYFVRCINLYGKLCFGRSIPSLGARPVHLIIKMIKWIRTSRLCVRCINLFGKLCFGRSVLIAHKVFLKSFCKSQFPQKSVNLFLMLVIVKNKSTNLWGG